MPLKHWHSSPCQWDTLCATQGWAWARCCRTQCSGAACPPTLNFSHQTVTSSAGLELAQTSREGNILKIDATWHPEDMSWDLGGEENQLLCTVSRKILFLIDGAGMKPLSWLRGPRPAHTSSAVAPLLHPFSLHPHSPVLSDPSHAGGAGQLIPRHGVIPQLRTATLGGSDLLPGTTDRYLMLPPFCQLLSGDLLG